MQNRISASSLRPTKRAKRRNKEKSDRNWHGESKETNDFIEEEVSPIVTPTVEEEAHLIAVIRLELLELTDGELEDTLNFLKEAGTIFSKRRTTV